MFEPHFDAQGSMKWKQGFAPDSHSSPVSPDGEVGRYFKRKYPILLDGALSRGDRPDFISRARAALRRGRVEPGLLPAEALREALDGIAAAAFTSPTAAGLVPVAPGCARIWWDKSLLDNLDDVLSQLDRPRAVLRFYDVTGLESGTERWNEFFDVDVCFDDFGHTAQCVRPDRAYAVDLGYVHADGRFLRLARTNAVTLPRDGGGVDGDGKTVRSRMRPRRDNAAGFIRPDADAREWAAARPDHSARDIRAETIVHMVYRAFLDEGPRALRRMPVLVRRDGAELEGEYLRRSRNRAPIRKRKDGAKASAATVLVARLDAARVRRSAPARCGNPPAAIAVPAWLASAARAADGRYAWFHLLSAAVRGGYGTGEMEPAVETPPVAAEVADSAEPVLVRDITVNTELSAALYSAPVFEAARNLRDALSASWSPDRDSLPRVPDATRIPAARAYPVDRAVRNAAEPPPERIFGGVEAKRMAKAGVRFNRMALTLEGKMRPGARLKVAGKLVHADVDGNFRLECVLSGKKASIPLRAGVSIGGEARSLINVEWEKRASRDKRKAF